MFWLANISNGKIHYFGGTGRQRTIKKRIIFYSRIYLNMKQSLKQYPYFSMVQPLVQ